MWWPVHDFNSPFQGNTVRIVTTGLKRKWVKLYYTTYYHCNVTHLDGDGSWWSLFSSDSFQFCHVIKIGSLASKWGENIDGGTQCEMTEMGLPYMARTKRQNCVYQKSIIGVSCRVRASRPREVECNSTYRTGVEGLKEEQRLKTLVMEKTGGFSARVTHSARCCVKNYTELWS